MKRTYHNHLKRYLLVSLAAVTLLAAFGAVQPTYAAGITVNTTDDELNTDGDCSLREAIQAANTDSVIDACTKGSGDDVITLPAGTYTLTTGAELFIGTNVTINGADAATTIVEASTVAPAPPEDSENPGQATWRVLAVDTGATVVLNAVTIRHGARRGTTRVGGGIQNSGSLTLTNSIISTNSADWGGGIINDGTLVVNGSTFDGNRGIWGGGIYTESETLTVQNSTFTNNSAYNGGALDNAGSTVEVSGSTFSTNTASFSDGGAILNDVGTFTLTDSTVNGNSGIWGAGLYNSATLTIVGSTINGNTALWDTWGWGGGIYSGGTLTVINSTISGNSADDEGGGINNTGTATLINTTITNNSAGSGGGGIYQGSGSLTATNTIVSGNPTGGNCDGAALTDGGGNLEYPSTSCGFGGALNDGTHNPILGVLQDNGGPTYTHALDASSPAINATGAACPAEVDGVDQRGSARDANCDIGAYEFTFALGTIIVEKQTVPDGDPTTFTFTGNAAGTLSDGQQITVTDLPPGVYTSTETVTHDWNLTSIVCDDANSTGDLGTATATFNLEAGETVTCVFTNSEEPIYPDTTGVFRPSNGWIYLKNQNTTGFADQFQIYGIAADRPIAGDWDGDGIDSIGVFRNGTFYLRNDPSACTVNCFADVVFDFGEAGDWPVAGDWDNDGIDEVGTFRDGTFYLVLSDTDASSTLTPFGLGVPGDLPIAGDWDGDGVDTVGVFRQTNGWIYLKNSNTTGFADQFQVYGIADDWPLAGDWNADGVDSIGVLRGNWFYLRNDPGACTTNCFADIVFQLGIDGDLPIAGEWDGQP